MREKHDYEMINGQKSIHTNTTTERIHGPFFHPAKTLSGPFKII